MYAYNRFWLRFANQPFSLDRLDVYEKHFTVMNYNDAELQQMFCHDFVRLFEEQNPGVLWEEVATHPPSSLHPTPSPPPLRSPLPPPFHFLPLPLPPSLQVERSIFSMLRGVFEGATALPPPQGIAPCPQVGRAACCHPVYWSYGVLQYAACCHAAVCWSIMCCIMLVHSMLHYAGPIACCSMPVLSHAAVCWSYRAVQHPTPC